MKKRRICSCALVNGHLLNCPLRNQVVQADFSDFLKIFKKLEKEYSQRNGPRDPKRIPKILKRLEKLWLKNPDLRLLQLISNVVRDNTYCLEDEELLAKLEKFYKNRS